jgi:hypothetical protein
VGAGVERGWVTVVRGGGYTSKVGRGGWWLRRDDTRAAWPAPSPGQVEPRPSVLIYWERIQAVQTPCNR